MTRTMIGAAQTRARDERCAGDPEEQAAPAPASSARRAAASRAVDFAGRGAWVWNADELSPETLVATLQRHGFQYLALKGQQGAGVYARNAAYIDDYARAAKKRGLDFGLWGYLTGPDAVAEARMAARLVRDHDLAFYIANAEVEYERATERLSHQFASTFRGLLPDLPAALSSFGRVDLHPDVDWTAWRDHGFEFQPQAYETDNAALTPALCIAAAERIWPRERIRPTVGAYDGHATRPSPQRLAASLREVKTRGFNVYRAGTATEEDYRALATVGSGATGGAWRALAADPPLPSGPDVHALQVALNARLTEMKLTRVSPDGDYGPITHGAAVYVAWRLGIGTRPATLRPLSVNRQRLIRHPDKRNATQLERAEERAKEPDGRVVRPLKTDPGPGSEFKLVVTYGAPGPDGKLYHAAKDWFAPGGSRVSAPVFGTVIEAKPSRTNSGKVYGGTVKIRALKDGKIWVFRHVDPKVGVNQPVIAGQPIARVTTWKDGPSHAHIEVWKTLSGGYRLVNMIDPMRYFR